MMYIKTYISFVVTFRSLKFFVITSPPSTSTFLTLLPPPQPLDDKHDRAAVTRPVAMEYGGLNDVTCHLVPGMFYLLNLFFLLIISSVYLANNGQCRPTKANAGPQQPMKAHNDQWRPTMTNEGPMTANLGQHRAVTGQQRPTTSNKGPMTTNLGQHRAIAGQQRPTTTNAGPWQPM